MVAPAAAGSSLLSAPTPPRLVSMVEKVLVVVSSTPTLSSSAGAKKTLVRTAAPRVDGPTALAPAAIRLRGGADMTFVNGVVKTPANVACVNMIAGEQTTGGRTTVRPADAALRARSSWCGAALVQTNGLIQRQRA